MDSYIDRGIAWIVNKTGMTEKTVEIGIICVLISIIALNTFMVFASETEDAVIDDRKYDFSEADQVDFDYYKNK